MIINVVAAVIRDEEGRILITQRNLKKAQGGLWEFPGGKIESEETKEHAIVREIKEELDVDIEYKDYLAEKVFEYPEKTINLIKNNEKDLVATELKPANDEHSAWNLIFPDITSFVELDNINLYIEVLNKTIILIKKEV